MRPRTTTVLLPGGIPADAAILAGLLVEALGEVEARRFVGRLRYRIERLEHRRDLPGQLMLPGWIEEL